MEYKTGTKQRYLSFLEVLRAMSKDWNVLLIILTVILLAFWNFMSKAGGITGFIKH